jgi:hypothetical protein
MALSIRLAGFVQPARRRSYFGAGAGAVLI